MQATFFTWKIVLLAVVLVGADGGYLWHLGSLVRTRFYQPVEGRIGLQRVTNWRDSRRGKSVEVLYHYRVGGEDFDGDIIRRGIGHLYVNGSFIPERELRKRGWFVGAPDRDRYDRSNNHVLDYRSGGVVTVFYDRRRPDRAVLLPGVWGIDLWPALALTALNGLGLAVLVPWWRARRQLSVKQEIVCDATESAGRVAVLLGLLAVAAYMAYFTQMGDPVRLWPGALALGGVLGVAGALWLVLASDVFRLPAATGPRNLPGI